MSFSPYLYFDGNCANAFEFYRSVFGGDFRAWMTFGEGPADMKVEENEKHKIMHVTLAVGDAILKGSDTATGFGEPPAPGTNYSISHSPSSKEEADAKSAKLKGGGAETMPLQDTFWGAYFGM